MTGRTVVRDSARQWHDAKVLRLAFPCHDISLCHDLSPRPPTTGLHYPPAVGVGLHVVRPPAAAAAGWRTGKNEEARAPLYHIVIFTYSLPSVTVTPQWAGMSCSSPLTMSRSSALSRSSSFPSLHACAGLFRPSRTPRPHVRSLSRLRARRGAAAQEHEPGRCVGTWRATQC
jgi:hypothetical protein